MISTQIQTGTVTQPTNPNPFDLKSLIYEFEFQYSGDKTWLRCDVSVAQAFAAIVSGLLNNKSISKVKLFAITEDTEGHVSFVYDVIAAKQGNNPWSLLPFHVPRLVTLQPLTTLETQL